MIHGELKKYLNKRRSVSNQEEDFSQFIIEQLKPNKSKFTADRLGNLYFTFNEILNKGQKQKQKHICICAHIDEPGLLISNINKDGTILFIRQGNFRMFDLINTRVRLFADKKKYFGIIQYKRKALSSIFELNNPKNYFIDFGFMSDKSAINSSVAPGQTIDFVSDTCEVADNKIMAKNINNRVSVATVIQNIQCLVNAAIKNETCLTVAFLVQKQIGNRGAYVIPENICADIYINLDGLPSNETFSDSLKSETLNNFILGAGPCIQVADPAYLTKPQSLSFLEKVFNSAKIKYQHAFPAEVSNCGALSMAVDGQIILPIAFPFRYNASPNQIAHLSDIHNYEKAIIKIVEALSNTQISNLQKISV